MPSETEHTVSMEFTEDELRRLVVAVDARANSLPIDAPGLPGYERLSGMLNQARRQLAARTGGVA